MTLTRPKRLLRLPRVSSFSLFFVALLIFLAYSPNALAQQQDDLYSILGIARQATILEIKQAYRRKALLTHPDKNAHLPADVAAENFRHVVHAFEILSDVSSRQQYDRTGRTAQAGKPSQQQQQWTFTWNYQRPIQKKLKDRFEVQQAQSRVLHVVSLEQLHTIMLDLDNNTLERSLLISFVQPGTIETLVNDEMVFPYPFAGMSSQGIWWEDLLQTMQIRYHTPNHPLAQFFHLQQLTEPVFFLARRGALMQLESFVKLTTPRREVLDQWVWEQLQVDVEFINQHDHAVEIYWIHGTRAHLKMTLAAGEHAMHQSMLSHEWWVRDARVDTRPDSPGRYKLTDATCLVTWKITNDTSPHLMVIERQSCFDLSGHCAFWYVTFEFAIEILSFSPLRHDVLHTF